MIDVLDFRPGPRRFLDARHEELMSLRFDRIELKPLAPTIGAEIRGVDLSQPVDEATFAEIERAFLEWKVIFFRDQDISSEQHTAFARRFGELEVHPFLPHLDGQPEVIEFSKDDDAVGVENMWHSDVTWREIPSLGSMLRSREVPDIGGDTLWADMEAAYLGLPEDLAKRIDGRVAVNDFTHSFGLAMPPEQLAEQKKKFPPAEHPVVRSHPVTGRKCLYVNGIFTSHIVGLPEDESDALLRALFAEARTPEYQCRFHWDKNSIAFWDNRCTQHYAANDYWPKRRVMERVTIIGDRPR